MPRAAFIVCHSGIGFPNGAASTLRVRRYASILSSLGYDVTVICSTFSELAEEGAENLSAQGQEDGIRFWYAGGSTMRAPTFLRRRLRSIKSWYRLVEKLVLQRPALVLTYPMTPLAALLLLPVTRLLGGLFLCDVSELPEVHVGNGAEHAARLRLYRWGLKRSDGVVVISSSLRERLSDEIHAGRLMLMPVLLDSQEFRTRSALSSAVRTDTIFYAGRLDDSKDGVGQLLEAFRIVHEQRPESQLVLVGEADSVVVDEYRARAEVLEVADATEFKGIVPRKDMLDEMCLATVLVTARPDTPQNRANMPTKLLEYLATGRPVVATAVGLACDMVADRKTGLLVAPGDLESMASAILWMFENPEEARRMAEAGRDYALSRFDYSQYVRSFGEFVGSLKNQA